MSSVQNKQNSLTRKISKQLEKRISSNGYECFQTGIGTSGKGIPIDEVPKEVLNEIYLDEKAVFGYSPKAGTAYAKMDFTEEEKVWLNREIRVDYLEATPIIQDKINEMTANGSSKKEIAYVVVDMRNKSKVEARNKMKKEDVEELEKRNIKKYGNPIGPDAEWLYEDKKEKAILEGIELSEDEIWDEIIKHSMKKDEVANTLLGIKH